MISLAFIESIKATEHPYLKIIYYYLDKIYRVRYALVAENIYKNIFFWFYCFIIK